jgi:sugar phosphate permease
VTLRRRRFVALVTSWQVVASSCYYSLFAATTFLPEAFGISRTLVGVAITTLTFGYTVVLFPSGAAVDAVGERPVLVLGAAALGTAAILAGLAPTYWLLLVAAVALGAAYATAMPASNRAIVAGVPASERGTAMGIKQVGVTGGSGLSAVIVVTVAPLVATWRAGFLAIGALALLVAGVFYLTYEGEPGSGDRRLPDLRGLGGDPTYLALVAAGLFLGATLFTVLGYTTVYLTEGAALSAGVAGLGFAAIQVAGGAGRVGAGRLTDALVAAAGWGPARAAAAVVLGQSVAGAALLAALAAGPGRLVALAVFVGVGATIVGFPGVYYACLAALVEDEAVGTATAGAQTALNAGALLAPPAFGWLADGVGFAAGWLLLVAITLLGAACAALVFSRAGTGSATASADRPDV